MTKTSAEIVLPRGTASDFQVPTLIDRAGKPAMRRFLEFFTVHIRNLNTRAAYGRAAAAFLAWCEDRGLTELHQLQPIHVAAYVEQLSRERSAPTVKQHLACLRMLFDWLVIGQVMPSNPAHAVRGPRHSVSKGATAVISSAEARELLDSMDAVNRRRPARSGDRRRDGLHLRTRERRGRPEGRGFLPAEKNAGGCACVRRMARSMKCPAITSWKPISMPTSSRGRHRAKPVKEPLFRAAHRPLRQAIGIGRMSRTDVWYMVRRRAADSGNRNDRSAAIPSAPPALLTI